jgi:hypothetical protein
MKPIFTSLFSGASEPAAHAACRTPGATSDINAAPDFKNLRRLLRAATVVTAFVEFFLAIFHSWIAMVMP